MFFNLNKREKGFTLIELLVVVAIIGILASVILVNLSRTRLKGKDASLQSSMSSARVAAELYFSDNGFSYNDFCTLGDQQILQAIADIDGVAGSNTITEVCEAAGNNFIIETQLNADSGTYYCVDSTGFSGRSNGDFDIDNGCVAV